MDGCERRALVIMLLALTPAFAEPKFPELTGRVVDQAKLLRRKMLRRSRTTSPPSKQVDRSARRRDAALARWLRYRRLRLSARAALEIGQAGKKQRRAADRGAERAKGADRSGRGLEPILTDFMSRLIIENTILPEFRRKDFPAGIKLGVRDIKETLLGDGRRGEAARDRHR